MTEEINYSYDGGLYAEMVRNRTFHGDWSGILYWYLVENGNAVAKMDTDRTTGPSDALKTSLRLDVEKASAGNDAGVLNVGYWGMAVRPNTEYKGSFYAKASSGDMGPVTVSLVSDQTGKRGRRPPQFPRSAPIGSSTIHAEDRRGPGFGVESPDPDRGPSRNALAQPRLALSAHLSQPRQRLPHRPDGEAGRHASRVPALPRR